jgi:c-di-GMP-binding flagellar brake protein YcgR
MTTTPVTSSLPRLSEMNLRIGQPIQVILHGPTEYKHYTRLIGFSEPEFVMVRVPMEQGWSVQLHNGQAVSIRLLTEVSIIEFSTSLQTFQLHPRNFMVLDYPSAIKETRFRAHERVKCNLPVNVLESPQAASAPFHVQDLSGGGASLVGSHLLGEPGQDIVIELSFELQATATHERLRLRGALQSVEPLGAASSMSGLFRHGVRFLEADPRLFLLVYELQKIRR